MVQGVDDPLYKDEYYLSYVYSLLDRLEHVSNEKSKNAPLLLPLAILEILQSNELQALFTSNVLKELHRKIDRLPDDERKRSLGDELKRLSEVQRNIPEDERGTINLLGYNRDTGRGIILRLRVGDKLMDISPAELDPIFQEARTAVDINILNKEIYPGASQYFVNAIFSIGGLRADAFRDIPFKTNGSKSFMLGMAVAYYSYAMDQPIPTNLAITGELNGDQTVPVEKFVQKIDAVLKERPNIRTIFCPSEQRELGVMAEKCQKVGVELKPVTSLSEALIGIFKKGAFENARDHFLNKKEVEKSKSITREIDGNVIGSKGLAGKKNLPGIEEYIESINIWLTKQINANREGSPILWINGEPGVGKSQIVAKLLESLKSDKRFVILPFFLTPDQRAISDFYKRCLYELTILFPQEITYGEERLKTQFLELMENTAALIPNPVIVLMVDGLDEKDFRSIEF